MEKDSPASGSPAIEGAAGPEARPKPVPPARVRLAFFERKVLLFLGDVVILNLALLYGLSLIPHRPPYLFKLQTVLDWPRWFLLLVGLWWLIANLMGAYHLPRLSDRFDSPITALKAGTVAVVVYFLVPYWSAPLTLTRLSWAAFAGLGLPGLGVWRFLVAVVLQAPALKRRVLIVGTGESGRALVQELQAAFRSEYEIVGFVSEAPGGPDEVDGVPVLGVCEELAQLAVRARTSVIALALSEQEHIEGRLFQAIMDCHERGLKISPMALLYEKLTGRVPVQHLDRQFFVNMLPGRVQLSLAYRLGRRMFDVAFAVTGLVLSVPLLPLIVLLVKLDSPGAVFFWQTRVGQGGRLFRVVKLRTMARDAEKDGARWAQENDSRITRFGKLARRARLDEIPQLWNVLRGEMSVIGPRPERPEFVRQLEREIPFYRSRHAIKPGLTGWAQVNYGYGASVDAALIKLQYDLYYIKYQSPYLDMLILFRTVGEVFTFKGR